MSGVAKFSPWLDATFEINTQKNFQKNYFLWQSLTVTWIGLPCCLSWFKKNWDPLLRPLIGAEWSRKRVQLLAPKRHRKFLRQQHHLVRMLGLKLNLINSPTFSPTLGFRAHSMVLGCHALLQDYNVAILDLFKSQVNALVEKWPGIFDESPLLMSDGGFEVSDWPR